jgi:Transposase DDE domain
MAFKKKLYQLNPDDKARKVVLQQTRREKRQASVTMQSNERHVREILCSKLSGTHMGLWLLIPEYLRLGAWDLLQGVFGKSSADDLNTRIAMQLVNESALCVNRIRPRGSLCNQGFALANGLSFLAADETVHELLDMNSVETYEQMQISLLQIRHLEHHFDPQHVFAIDPHRIPSTTQRTMPCKKKRPDQPAQKMLQTFFCVDAYSGQPLAFNLGSSGKNCSSASLQLISMIERSAIGDALFVADKEHFTREIASWFYHHPQYDILMPAPDTSKTVSRFGSLAYTPCWPGYALACTTFRFENSPHDFRMIVQRQGEQPGQYQYKAFLTTSAKPPAELLTKAYPERWTIEEFFNFEGDMGWNRASTFNLNIKYGKQSLALIAQAAAHKLKTKLPQTYKTWTAEHTAREVLTNMEGDIRVVDDNIIVTCYRDHEKLNLKEKFENLPQILEAERVNPRIPWLFDYKLNFRFK